MMETLINFHPPDVFGRFYSYYLQGEEELSTIAYGFFQRKIILKSFSRRIRWSKSKWRADQCNERQKLSGFWSVWSVGRQSYLLLGFAVSSGWWAATPNPDQPRKQPRWCRRRSICHSSRSFRHIYHPISTASRWKSTLTSQDHRGRPCSSLFTQPGKVTSWLSRNGSPKKRSPANRCNVGAFALRQINATR